MSFEWTVIWSHWDALLRGFGMSLAITSVALAIGVTLGLVLCASRLSGRRGVAGAARGYITFFRITPEMVLIFWAYFCLPPLFDLRLSAWLSGTLALGLVAAAYLAEIFRAGIEAVPRGQIEAAKALGLGPVPRWLRILLPQAIRRMAPAFLNYLTEILKNSTLLAGIGVAELAYEAYTLGAMTYRYLELFTAIGVLFFAIIFPLSLLTRWREAELARQRGD
jgi:His/Glu/Gln/Arg/opine family amino acid ABC transporter permease subunit